MASFLFALVLSSAAVPAWAAVDEGESASRIERISALADRVPEVKPEFAADCRFAFTLGAMLARNINVAVRGDDEAVAQNAEFHSDVWGLVLYREAVRTKKDPMKVRGKFISKNSRVDMWSKTRSSSGLFSRVEKQMRLCDGVANPADDQKDTGMGSTN